MLCRQFRRRPSTDTRLVWATGKNIVVTGVKDKGRRYLSDFYTTLIDIKWRWNLLFFVLCFVFTWLAFACFYFLLCVLHGDLVPDHVNDENWKPCVKNVKSFTSAYLFSIETMTTIGYGSRHQTEECLGVYLAVMLQSVVGAGLHFALASLVVSKIRRAKRRSQTILFSDTAVTFREDGKLKLAVRIGDMRKGDVIGAHATGMLIKKTMGREGQKVPVRMFSVPFKADGGRGKLFLYWPALLVHVVDEHSPLWPLSRDDLLNQMYELIVILDGVAASTSKPFQARKSYHSWEILWGHRFRALDMSDNYVGYVVNYQHFHDTYPVAIPLCSAMELERTRFAEELSRQEYAFSRQESEVSRQESELSQQVSVLSGDTFDDVESSSEESDEDGDDEGGELSKKDTELSLSIRPGRKVKLLHPHVHADTAPENRTGACTHKRVTGSESVTLGTEGKRRENVESVKDEKTEGEENRVLSGIYIENFERVESSEFRAHRNIPDDQKEAMNALTVTVQNDTADQIPLELVLSGIENCNTYSYDSHGKTSDDQLKDEIGNRKAIIQESPSADLKVVNHDQPDGVQDKTEVENQGIRAELEETFSSEVHEHHINFNNEENARQSGCKTELSHGVAAQENETYTEREPQLERRDNRKEKDACTQTGKIQRKCKEGVRETSKVESTEDSSVQSSPNDGQDVSREFPQSSSREIVQLLQEIEVTDTREQDPPRARRKSNISQGHRSSSRERKRKTSKVEFQETTNPSEEFRIRQTSMAAEGPDRVRKTSRVEFQAGTKDNDEKSRRLATVSNPGSRSNSRERVRKTSKVEFTDNSYNKEERVWRVSTVSNESTRSSSSSRKRVHRTSRAEFLDRSDNNEERVRRTSRTSAPGCISSDRARGTSSVEFADNSDNNDERAWRASRLSRQSSSGSNSSPVRLPSRLSPDSGERVRRTSRVEFAETSTPSVRRTFNVEQPVSPTSQAQRRISFGDALNMYKHRRSVTDTYLGTEIGDDSEDSEESAAILSIVSQRTEKRPDVRDVFKLRRKSVPQNLLFGTEDDADTEKKSAADSRQRKLSVPHKK